MTTWTAEVSPFVFDGPVAPDQLVGRTAERASLAAWAQAGRLVALVAPRRYGKTSLLDAVAHDVAVAHAMTPVVADLYGAVSLADVVVRLEAAWRSASTRRERLRASAQRVFAGAQVGLSIVGTGFQLQLAKRPDTDPVPALHLLLDLPVRLQPDRQPSRFLVILDEFQDLLKLRDAEAILRSHVQHQRDVASYIFSGSEPGMIAAAFTDADRPFYAQAEVKRLGRLPASAVTDSVVRGFRTTGKDAGDALEPLVSTADGHPQRAMLLAHMLWTLTPVEGRADLLTWERALAATERRVRDELAARWDRLEQAEQRTLRAVVQFGSPYVKAAGRQLALPVSTASRALKRLLAQGILEQANPEATNFAESGVRVVDPLFARWVADRAVPEIDAP